MFHVFAFVSVLGCVYMQYWVSCRLKTEKVGPEAEMIRKGG
jgi:hypothetical protein